MTADPISSNSVGIGLRSEHCELVACSKPAVDWFEVHSENYFGEGGRPHTLLEEIRKTYALSLHGVGLSLGSTDNLNLCHLKRLKQLIAQYQPTLVSEHLSWSSVDGNFFHDLLPLPMTEDTVDHLVNRINQVQDYLGRQIMVENASTYLEYSHPQMPEWEFVNEVTAISGCDLLLDVNNVFVNACNHKFDPVEFLQNIRSNTVGEIHLSGHALKQLPNLEIRIDTHDRRVCNEVWELFEIAAKRFPHAPTLIEWDKDLPEFSVLMQEAEIAKNYKQYK